MIKADISSKNLPTVVEQNVEEVIRDLQSLKVRKTYNIVSSVVEPGCIITHGGLPVVTRGTLGTPTWIPDSWVRFCHQCKRQFGRFSRKHHCRHCGNIFCDGCSSKRFPILKFTIKKPVRICDTCSIILLQEHSLKMLEEIRVKFPKLRMFKKKTDSKVRYENP